MSDYLHPNGFTYTKQAVLDAARRNNQSLQQYLTANSIVLKGPAKTQELTPIGPGGEAFTAPSFTPVYRNNQEVTWQQAKDDIDVYKTLSRDEKKKFS